jgi:hypothetical protein
MTSVISRLVRTGRWFIGDIDEEGPPSPRSTADVEDAIDAVADAIERSSQSVAGTERIKGRIRALCIVSRRADVPIESLLIRLRRRIEQRNVMSQVDARARKALQQDIVSQLIAMYYFGR